MKKLSFLSTAVVLVLMMNGCSMFRTYPPMTTTGRVDLQSFMGDWYVIANIPTFIEKGAYNAIESYALNEDGTIATTFTFNKGAFDGPQKRYTPKGFIRDKETNAIWGMRFVWPFKSDFRIAHVSEDYSQTIIARKKRDYVWIMARTPVISENDFARLKKLTADLGYDVSKLNRVPQRKT